MSESWRFEAIGTAWEITTDRPLDDATRAAVSQVIAEFDQQWSRFRSDSLVRQLADAGGSVPAPPDAEDMLAVYAAASAATGGAVNPLVGGSLEALGYDADYSLRARIAEEAPAAWPDLLRVEAGELRLDAPAVIDIGALGKGRLVDLVLDELNRVGGPDLGSVTVDASGDLRVTGEPVRVALEHPYNATRAIGVWTVNDQALAASASNRRAWGDGLHHVLDARTGLPVREIVATWAVASDAMTADAAATALFFDGGPAFAAAADVGWVRMLSDGRAEYSPGCPAELFFR